MNSKKKIAVCLPSYNESENIINITKKIDKYLKKYSSDFDIYIVNCDNNSSDHTNDLFNSVDTNSKKISIIYPEKGKGYNLLNFFKFARDNKIDYALTIDSDVVSLEQQWVDSFLTALINDKYDYVVPIYKRSRFEGSTTNHFAFPLVYSITGYKIRQPIAGDFGFNKKFIECIYNKPYNHSITQYGIDIYMTLIACCNQLKIKQIKLKEKKHNPSYSKIENMFLEVLDASIFTLRNICDHHFKFHSDNLEFNNDYMCISKNRSFKHKKRALELNSIYHINGIDVETEWILAMARILTNINDDIDPNYYLSLFIDRATKFWLKAQYMSAIDCEKIIINQANQIRDFCCKGADNNEYSNKK